MTDIILQSNVRGNFPNSDDVLEVCLVFWPKTDSFLICLPGDSFSLKYLGNLTISHVYIFIVDDERWERGRGRRKGNDSERAADRYVRRKCTINPGTLYVRLKVD